MDKLKNVGDTLENGYVIIEKTDGKVLAHKESKEEYATWLFSPHGDTIWGHYFSYWRIPKEDAYQLALTDYKARN
jgi:hypothetical protein